MKKNGLIISFLLTIVCMMATGCSSCQSENKKQDVVNSNDLSVVKSPIIGEMFYVESTDNGQLNAEHCISTDKQWMYMNNGDKYFWFETTVKYKQLVSDPDFNGEIEYVNNIFQRVVPVDDGSDVICYSATTNKNGTIYNRVFGPFFGDHALNDEIVKLTFDDAYEALTRANVIKPDSRYVVLRKPVDKDSETEYIFGNPNSGIVTVNAETGEVKVNLGSPLGEWP